MERKPTATRAEPAPKPAAVEPKPNGTTVAIEVVRSAWATVVERTRERSIGKAAQLLTAEPLAVEGATIVLSFADDFARGVWQDRQRPELERDLSSVLGVDVRVRCVRQPPRGEAPPATEDPMLRAALETFRRPERILEVD
jgi:hypothetical protein